MDQKEIITLWWESGLSPVCKNHLTTFCKHPVDYVFSCLCYVMVHFIRNNCLYFVRSARALTVRDPTFGEFVPRLGISATFGEKFGELRYPGIF